MALPGPNSPRRRPPKPYVPKSIKTRAVRLSRAGAAVAALRGSKYRYGKPVYPAGPGIQVQAPGGTPGASAPPAGGLTANPGLLAQLNPYAGMPDWAQRELRQIDSDQAAHQAYAGKVGDWLSGALKGLTGVDPSAPGLGPAMQQQYLANVQGVVGGAMNAAAAGAQGPAITPTTPGGIAASPTSYLTGGAIAGAQGRASSMLQSAQVNSALSTLQNNTQAQAYIKQYADMQAGLPAIYSQRKLDAEMKIDDFIQKAQQVAAKDAETMRHNKVQEATSAWNAYNGAVNNFARTGIDATKFGADQANQQIAATTPAPPGMVAVPNGKGGVTFKNDPTYVKPGGGGGGTTASKPLTKSQISSMNGRWKRGPNDPPKLGPGWKQPVYDPGTKLWYAKRAAGGGGSTAKPKGFGTLSSDLLKKWNGSGGGAFSSGAPGWSETFRGNPSGIADSLSGWVIENSASFNTSNGKFDPDKLHKLLATLGDGNRKFALVWPLIKKRLKNGVLV